MAPKTGQFHLDRGHCKHRRKGFDETDYARLIWRTASGRRYTTTPSMYQA